MKSKNYAIKFLLSIVATVTPFYPVTANVIPVFERTDQSPRLMYFTKNECNNVEVKMISNSPTYHVYPSENGNRTGHYVILTPTEALLKFDNGKTVREMGIFRTVGNWSRFESKSITMARGTGGRSVNYQDKLICYFYKNTPLEDLQKYRGF
tara:strand:+ start:175 stop:630 length:456 start_codon:yes stop_codon:yes gene_type:complete